MTGTVKITLPTDINRTSREKGTAKATVHRRSPVEASYSSKVWGKGRKKRMVLAVEVLAPTRFRRAYREIAFAMNDATASERRSARRGASAIEYIAVLGLLVLTVVGGLALFSDSLRRSLGTMEDRIAGQVPVEVGKRHVAATSNLPVTSIESKLPLHGFVATEHLLPRWKSAVPTVIGLLGLCLMASIRRRRRKRRAKTIEIDEAEGESPELHQRFSAKRQDLLRVLARDPNILLRNQVLVRHLMSTDVLTVPPGANRQSLKEVMREAKIRHLLVCGSDRQLLGVVSDRDLAAKPGRTARELMSTSVKIVAPDTLISPAVTHLLNSGVSALPVIEAGKVVGILTTTDLAMALQCLLQLWLHTTQMMQSEAWQEEMLQASQQGFAGDDGDVCFGAKGILRSLLDRAMTVLETEEARDLDVSRQTRGDCALAST